MLKGFEDLLVDLTEKEIPVCKRVCVGLERKIGKANAITNLQMRQALSKENLIVSDIVMRKIIQYIRQNNMIPKLCSTSTGYFVAANEEEFADWVLSMKQRARSIKYTLHCAVQGTNIDPDF